VSTRTILGAAALGRATDEEAATVLDLLLEFGINAIDTAASYGRSERRVGTCMDRHRDTFLFATTEKSTSNRAYALASASRRRHERQGKAGTKAALAYNARRSAHLTFFG